MMSYKSLLQLSVVTAVLFAGSLSAQEARVERVAAIKDSLRQRYTQKDYETYLKKLKNGEVISQGGEVPSHPTAADALVNNNNGSTATSGFTQSEQDILAFGNNVVVAFNDAGSNTASSNQFTGYAYSTDGGATFTDGGLLPASVVGDAGDPVLARNETTGRIYLSTLGFSGAGTIQMWRSDDNGHTWMAPIVATPGGGSEDKQWHCVDNFPGTGNGNVYLVSRNFGTGNGIFLYRSTDQGATFIPSGGVNIVTGNQGAFVTVGSDHSVYAFWYAGTTLQVRKSIDFGVSFSTAVTVASGLVGGSNGDLGLTGIRQGTSTASAFRSSEFPHAAVNPVSGHIYVTFNNKGAGSDKADIFLVTSTNGGTSWSAAVKVNDDVTTTDQWQPTIAVTPSGSQVGIFYYSRQEDVANNLFKFYGRIGTIAGSTITFSPSFAISDVASYPEFGRDALINTTYMSDYSHAVATASAFQVVWSDNRSDLAAGPPRKDPNVYYKSILTTQDFGWAKGTITNLSGGAALAGVAVDFLESPNVPSTSQSDGFYKSGVKVDTPATTRNVTLRAKKFGFRDTSLAVTVTRNDTVTRNFAMTPVASGTLVVRTVRKDSTNIASFVTIRFAGNTVDTGTTNGTTGILSKTLPAGSYDITIDPPSPYGTRVFNSVVINSSATTPLYVVVRTVLENSPAAMRDTLGVGQVHAKTLTLTNTTTDSVQFRITDDNALRVGRIRVIVPEPAQQIEPPQRKGEPDIDHSDSPDAHGGPDTFGYSWIDSDDPGGPTPAYVDISSIGTQITAVTSGTLDDGYATVALPWTFTFYGNPYSSINIGTNGFVNFGTGSTALTNDSPPTAAAPNNAIYAFWDDLDFRTRGKLLYYNDVANSRFIVAYHQVPRYSSSTETDTLSFQIILKPNGEVAMQFQRMASPTLNSATTGIENAAGTVGLAVQYNSASYIHNNLAVRFYLPDAPWISETPLVGTIPPGTNQNIQVTFDATGLTQGTTYNASLFVDATHPDVSSPFSIPASLKVNSASGPLIILARTSVTFPSTEVGTTSWDSVTVRNGGNATLNLTSVTSSSSRFTVTASASAIVSGDSARIRIAYNAVLPAGADTGRVIVLSNDPSLPRVDITLNGTSIRVAHFTASPDSFYFSRPQGTDTTTAILKIKSTGSDTLRYKIIEALCGMLDASLPPPGSFVPMQLGKGELDPRQGWSSPLGQGGPDAFGYRWIDSDEPGGPAFGWIDISGTGSALDSTSAWVPTGTFTGGDEGYYPVRLPFSFSFYGVAKDSIFIGSNGNIMFQRPTGNVFTNAAFPTAADAIDNHIGVWWDDLQVRAGAKVYYGTSGGNFVVQYQGMALYNATVQNYTFEAILIPGGAIKLQYLSMGFNGGTLISSSIGIENNNATIGLGTVFNAAYMHNNLAITYSSDILPWLITDRTSGTIAPGDSQNVQVRVIPNQPPGTYTGHVKITGNTSDTKNVGVRLDITSGSSSITATSPNGGEVWTRGSSYPITWTTTGSVDTVVIDFSTNGVGGPWTSITSGTPARIGTQRSPDGTYNWTIPAGTTPSTNCYVRVLWKSNATVSDLSNSAFTIQQISTGDTTLFVNYLAGWNLVSNPVANPIPGDSVKQLFPASINPFAFEFSGGYVQRYILSRGKGYWAKFLGGGVDTISGTIITRDSISVVTGWNIVGSISRTVDTSMIMSVPLGLKTSNWFGYGSGYSATTQINPGKGYFVKTNGAGKFVLANPVSFAVIGGGTAAGGSIDALNSLTITDSNHGSQHLYFGSDATNEISLALYAMPPVPPVGAFDARFETSDGGSMVQLHAVDLPGAIVFPVSIQSDAYPLTISWNISNGSVSYELADGSNGTGFNSIAMMGSGSIQITNADVSRVVVKGIGKGSLPTEYALSQNYPNPFNPTTRIQYQLPLAGRVTLKVFDVLGREVRTLVDRFEEAGYKSVEFEAKGFASGVYFYRLEAGKFLAMRKLLVLK